MGLISHDRHASEDENRVHWWLTETGEFPPVEVLRAIRKYRESIVGGGVRRLDVEAPRHRDPVAGS